ncbi:MAG: MlaD family protein [Cyclonatronaceae bacterium]
MKNQVKVALTILAAILVALFGYRFMSEMPLFSQTYVLSAEFERADGLVRGSPVLMRGVKIGSVSRIRFEDDALRVRMTFADEDVPITEGSVAYIRSVQVIEKAIEIERGESTERLETGSTIEGVYDSGIMGTVQQLGDDVSESLAQSIERLNNVLGQVDDLLDSGGGRENIEGSLSGLNNTLSSVEMLVENRQDEIEDSITHLRNTLRQLDELSSGQEEEIQAIISNLESTTNRLDRISEEIDVLAVGLNEVVRKVNEGEGSLGKLVNDPSLYDNLDSLSQNLDTLVKDINENPREYLKHMRLIEVF